MGMKLNVGCGQYPLPGWLNLDAGDGLPVDVRAIVPELPFRTGSVDEVYAGHLVEHLTPAEARAFLGECRRVLVPGGHLGIVVPDTFEIMRRYVDLSTQGRVEYPLGVWRDMHDLDEVCALFTFSTVQASPHRWNYDLCTLSRLLECSGFRVTGQINRWMDPRVTVGAWYQCGLDAVVGV